LQAASRSGAAIFQRGTILPSDAHPEKSPSAVDKGKDLLTAYRKDPERFRGYSNLLDTALNASIVGDAALQMRLPSAMPSTSEGITSVRRDQKIDSWGHPFCLMAAGDRFAVISAGPDATTPISCLNLHIAKKEILSSERKLYQRPSGEVVLILDLNSPKRAAEQALQQP